ncbi:MAG: energy-coupling factor transporter ATPase, partial [Oscillospiraceae bacterium]
DDGSVVMDDVPSNVFSQVEKMKAIGLDVPQVTELMYALGKEGYDTDVHIINEEDCAEALMKLLV